MTHEEINALPDDRLTALVAEKVMGWPVQTAPWNGKETAVVVQCDGDYEYAFVRVVNSQRWDNSWRPLQCWDECMDVVTAMRAKGFAFELYSENMEQMCTSFYRKEGTGDRLCNNGDERRAILRAALAAVEVVK